MTSTSLKQNLKRPRPNTVKNDVGDAKMWLKIEYNMHRGTTANLIHTFSDFQPSKFKRRDYFVRQNNLKTVHLLTDNSKRSNGRLFRKQSIFFQAIFIAFTISITPSFSIVRFVSGELHRGQSYGDEINRNRSNSNRLLEGGEQKGIHTLVKYRQAGSTAFLDFEKQQHGGCRTKNGRELVGEALKRFIRQKNVINIVEEKLPPALRGGFGAESSSLNQIPYETNVSSYRSNTLPPRDEPITTLDYGDSIKKGNPLIQNTLPINFHVELLVQDIVTNDLLKVLEVTLENYLQLEYQNLIDRGNSNDKAGDISNFSSKTLKLEEVDLILSLVKSKWWQEKHSRRLFYSYNVVVKGLIRSRRRNMEEGDQSSNAKLLTISVDGSVHYSMEVDGSLPTPDDIERKWNETYNDIIAENRLQRAIEDADIDGVIQLEQVTTEDPSDQVDNNLDSDTTEVSNGNAGHNGYINTSSNENITSLYEDNADDNINESSLIDASGNNDEKNSSANTSFQLKRPSTLSIIFGFILTGIAILGLVFYAYLCYRKRKKRLKKKRKMKESITFSSASAAVATAASASNGSHNSHNFQQNIPRLTSNLVDATHSSRIHLNSFNLSETESEETSYKGLQSSIGSEDVSDSFAKELKLAASLDQEGWNESKRMSANIEKREGTRVVSKSSMARKNRNLSSNATVPSLLSNDPTSLQEDETEEEPLSWTNTFPYGDEAQVSVLPSLLEGEKDVKCPSEFFAQKLKNIEKGLAVSGEEKVEMSREHTNATDDSCSTSDILSEVSELSRYVRRYERRRGRRIKREEHLHERLGVREGTLSYSSDSSSMSIAMDGRVNKAHISNDYDGFSPLFARRMESNSLSSYAESYRDAQQHETSVLESMSLVSDDKNDAEEKNSRSQRLGISPYLRSSHEVYYKNSTLRNEGKSTTKSTPTISLQKNIRMKDDYRYYVGYNQNHNKSSPSRLADLRATDAIIDNSNSEVNLHYHASGKSNDAINVSSKKTKISGNKTIDTSQINPGSLNKSVETTFLTATSSQQSNRPIRALKSTNRFDKLRGLFEQKTNDRPQPIYPPGEHWQYAGSLGK